MGSGRYKWRTAMRERLPWFVGRLIAKGRRDCGKHDWYNSDGRVERCYHCEVGQRPYDATHFVSHA